MRPLIGIVPLYDTEKQSYWMLPGYMRGAGSVPGCAGNAAADPGPQ